jgi:hypothetical protein
MISIKYRHMNFNSYTQILERQLNSSAITHFRPRNLWHPFKEPSLRNTDLQDDSDLT